MEVRGSHRRLRRSSASKAQGAASQEEGQGGSGEAGSGEAGGHRQAEEDGLQGEAPAAVLGGEGHGSQAPGFASSQVRSSWWAAPQRRSPR